MYQKENHVRQHTNDRFIPKREINSNFDYKLLTNPQSILTPRKNLLNIFPNLSKNVLNFKDKTTKKLSYRVNTPPASNKCSKNHFSNSKIIKNGAQQVLDIPGFKNDYYLNLIDALNSKMLVTILSSSVFIFNRKLNKVALLNSLEKNSQNFGQTPTSVKFNPLCKNKLAVGLGQTLGELYVVDW